MKTLFVLSVTVGLCAASYPTQYPFESESLVPPAPLEATPSLTFDENDAGGYVYTYGYMYDMTESDTEEGFCYMRNGLWSHQNVVRNSAPPVMPFQDHNCSANGNKLGEASYFGTVAEVQICAQGECCENYWGTWTYWNSDSPYMGYYDDIGKVYEDGLCEEMFGEPMYCTIMNGAQQWGCIEQYITPTERQVIVNCYDYIYNHYAGCKLYQIEGYMWRPQTEPEGYRADSSAEQINAVNALYFAPDRVCHPYSYYFPEYAASSASQSEGQSSSESSMSDTSESSSAAALVTIAAAFVAAFVV